MLCVGFCNLLVRGERCRGSSSGRAARGREVGVGTGVCFMVDFIDRDWVFFLVCIGVGGGLQGVW